MNDFIPSAKRFTDKVFLSAINVLKSNKKQNRSNRLGSRESRPLQLQQLEQRAVFASAAGVFNVPAGLQTVEFEIPSVVEIGKLPSGIKFSDLFAGQLKSLIVPLKDQKQTELLMKLSAKPPKLSKELLGSLKSNPAFSQWQVLNPAERFSREVMHAAHETIAELLPRKSSLSSEEFVSSVLNATRLRFIHEGDNSLSSAERFAYLQGARGMAAFVLSDAQKNQEMARYLARRFSEFSGNVRSLAEDAFRSSTFELAGKFVARPSTTGMTNVQEKFNTAADYAADRAILDLRDQHERLTDSQFVVGAIAMARTRFMNDAGSFLTPAEASAYLRAMKTGGQSALVDYYSNRFNRDHLESVTSRVLLAAAEVSFRVEGDSATAPAPVAVPPSSSVPSSGTNLNAVVSSVSSASSEVDFGLEVNRRLEQRAIFAASEAIQEIRREGKPLSDKEFIAEVRRRARSVFATTAHLSLTIEERRTYERAIRNNSTVALQRYFAYRFDNQYVALTEQIARDRFKD